MSCRVIKRVLISFLCCFVWLVSFSNIDVGASPLQYDTSPVYTLEWSPDGTKIALSGGEQPCDPTDLDKFAVRIVDASTGSIVQRLVGHSCDTDDVDWSPDGQYLVSTSQFEPAVRIWDLASGTALHTYTRYTFGNDKIQWNPVNDLIASAYFTNSVLVWHMSESPENALQLSLNGTFIDWHPSGDQLAFVDAVNDQIEIYDFDTEQIRLNLQGDKSGTLAIDWHSDGQYVASGANDGIVRVWDATDGQLVYMLTGHTASVSNVQWRPNTNQIASSSDDRTIRIWDTLSHQQVEVFQVSERVNDLDWSPDGAKLAYSDGGVLEIVTPASKPNITSTPFPMSTRSLILTPTARH